MKIAKHDAIILQLKKAGKSVLEPYTTDSHCESPAQRVVQGKRLTQVTSDIFLGWSQGVVSGIDYYWRQLNDRKGSLDVSGLDKKGFETYLQVCAAPTRVPVKLQPLPAILAKVKHWPKRSLISPPLMPTRPSRITRHC